MSGKHFTTEPYIPSVHGSWFLKVEPVGLGAWGHFLKEGPSCEFYMGLRMGAATDHHSFLCRLSGLSSCCALASVCHRPES